jgi:two-component system, sporulation sensor kinase D
LDIYLNKKRWKIILGLVAIVIVSISLWYSNILARQISQDERRNITIWADAMQSRAQLLHYTQTFFEQIKTEERKRVELLAEAFKRIGETEDDTDALDFYMKIIQSNTTIPVIITDSKGRITLFDNLDPELEQAEFLEDELKEEFTKYEPVSLYLYGREFINVYYKDSKTFTQLREYLENLERSFISEVLANSVSVPVVITDTSMKHVVAYGNIDKTIAPDNKALLSQVQEMASENKPIKIQFSEGRERLIFYKTSHLLTQLKYYPYFQFGVIAVFIIVAYLLFSTARKSEQNQVWAGLAKETAHQLGTPLSAIMAWIEILKLKGVDAETTAEMEKDVNRLQVITERFSKIGSAANLQDVNIIKEIEETATYLQTRTSKKIKLTTRFPENQELIVPLNKQLFSWVIENLWRNATDAISGNGRINIIVNEEARDVVIDFCDSGKGISKSNYSSVFNPGYTSKQRGWGLGLSLARRIIEDYHRGKIFIKSSALGKGTVFRIVLRKK